MNPLSPRYYLGELSPRAAEEPVVATISPPPNMRRLPRPQPPSPPSPSQLPVDEGKEPEVHHYSRLLSTALSSDADLLSDTDFSPEEESHLIQKTQTPQPPTLPPPRGRNPTKIHPSNLVRVPTNKNPTWNKIRNRVVKPIECGFQEVLDILRKNSRTSESTKAAIEQNHLLEFYVKRPNSGLSRGSDQILDIYIPDHSPMTADEIQYLLWEITHLKAFNLQNQSFELQYFTVSIEDPFLKATLLNPIDKNTTYTHIEKGHIGKYLHDF